MKQHLTVMEAALAVAFARNGAGQNEARRNSDSCRALIEHASMPTLNRLSKRGIRTAGLARAMINRAYANAGIASYALCAPLEFVEMKARQMVLDTIRKHN